MISFIEYNLMWFIVSFFLMVLAVVVFVSRQKHKGQSNDRQIYADEHPHEKRPLFLVRYPTLCYILASGALSIVGVAILGKQLYDSWVFLFMPLQMMALVYAGLVATVSFIFKKTNDDWIFATKLRSRGFISKMHNLFQAGWFVGMLLIVVEITFIYLPVFDKIEVENERLIQVKIEEINNLRQTQYESSELNPDLEFTPKPNTQDIEIEARQSLKGDLVKKGEVIVFVGGHIIILVVLAHLLNRSQVRVEFFEMAGEYFEEDLTVSEFERGLVLSLLPGVKDTDVLLALSKWFKPEDIKFVSSQQNGQVDQVVLLSTVIKTLGIDIDILELFIIAKNQEIGNQEIGNQEIEKKIGGKK